jgi:hypothetical protein
MAQSVVERTQKGPQSVARAVIAILGLCSVAALLAWAYRLGPFWAWFWGMTAPALGVLGVIGVVSGRRPEQADLHRWLVLGAVGGLLGTAAYDLVRVPFALFGYRLLSPIDSYGLLLLNAHHSSPVSGWAGWLYHLGDGVGFAIAYAVIARGRAWWWGLLWGSTLETISLLTPLAGLYGISGKPDVIALACGGHLAYGAAVGLVVQHHDASIAYLRGLGRHAVVWMMVGAVGGLALWLRPWSSGRAQPAVTGGHLSPQWIRVAPGECVAIRNNDDATYVIAKATPPARLDPLQTSVACFDGKGVKRLKVGTGAWSGGFVLVDQEAHR